MSAQEEVQYEAHIGDALHSNRHSADIRCMSKPERRVENRFLCAELVRVEWEDSESKAPPRVLNAVLEDISAPGACVQVEQSIGIDSPITLTIGKASFSGRVSYSVFRDYGYFVGIRFSDETVWSADMVVPEHLTDLAEIVTGNDTCRRPFQ